MKSASSTLARNLRFVLTSALVTLAFAASAFAHGGFDHVMGTVVSVADNVLMVKTDKGNVAVKLDAKTELTKNDQKAVMADLVAGTRVIVDLPEGGKDKPAHSVKIGVVAATHDPKH